MEHRSLFRDVDLVAPKHRVDALTEVRFLGQTEQQLQGFVGDPILRIIELDSFRLGRQSFATLGVFRKKMPEMDALNLLVMRLERAPSRAVAKCGSAHRLLV